MRATRENIMKRLLLLFLLCFGLVLPGVAADGTSFNPTTISVKSVGASIPVGTVITWPSNSWPSDRDNWLECNGQSISSAVYPELVALIGGIVPNYRGYFLRGVGGSSAALGVEQQDAMQRITGGIRTAPQKTDEVGDNTWGAYYVSATGRGCNVYRTGDNAWSYKDTVFDSARVVRTAEETRPLNRAVRYLIRAR